MPTETPNDRVLFERLLRAHERQLFGYIFSLVRNLADADDLFQETCLALWEQFAQFEVGTNFAAWASTVARFRVLKFLDRVKRPHIAFSDEAHAHLLEVAGESDPREEEVRREALALCVQKLQQGQQTLLWEVYSGKVKVNEVAEKLNRSTHSIYSSLRHIRGVLMRCVELAVAREGSS